MGEEEEETRKVRKALEGEAVSGGENPSNGMSGRQERA